MLSTFVKNSYDRIITFFYNYRRNDFDTIRLAFIAIYVHFRSYPQPKSHDLPIIVDKYVEKVENISTFTFLCSAGIRIIAFREKGLFIREFFRCLRRLP